MLIEAREGYGASILARSIARHLKREFYLLDLSARNSKDNYKDSLMSIFEQFSDSQFGTHTVFIIEGLESLENKELFYRLLEEDSSDHIIIATHKLTPEDPWYRKFDTVIRLYDLTDFERKVLIEQELEHFSREVDSAKFAKQTRPLPPSEIVNIIKDYKRERDLNKFLNLKEIKINIEDMIGDRYAER